MRKTILAAATVLLMGGGLAATAQPAPGCPPAGGPAAAGPASGDRLADDPGHGPGEGWMRHHGMMGRMHHRPDERPFDPRTFALICRQADRQLAPADVQKIAEAFLLWNGNHSWKVIDVAAAGDNAIGFAIATPEGSVIARFTMDPHTGRVTRTG
jgi:hypothetical protein